MSHDEFRVHLPDDQKLGLALSGGGFRAAFFHVGVLAQLAEHGLLRHVEVISTVSGGSIVGALYYLYVKNLLESQEDTQITDRDYVNIMGELEKHFLKAVQRNIRTLTFADSASNWKMRQPEYSRSDRIGELYDEHLYRPLMDPGGKDMIRMRDLKISPLLADGTKQQDFVPDKNNKGRQAKVPILLINCTTLNSGHNWRFEATRMGEPPRKGWPASDIDKNSRLLRAANYAHVSEHPAGFELGLAVAASACVPGIFHPLAISDLYPNLRVQLVDGGVHDNQGIKGLLDRNCNFLVVSDACGQLRDEREPDTRFSSVLKRSNNILMDRVREEELFHLLNDKERQTVFCHLRKGVGVELVPWNGPNDVIMRDDGENTPVKPTSKDFGVDPEVQALLSKIRTDLDSFTDVEAYSLMMDGYLMTGHELKTSGGLSGVLPADEQRVRGKWDFAVIAPWLKNPSAQYLRQLKVGAELFFKVFRLNMPLAAAALSLAGIFLLALIFWVPWDRITISLRTVLISVLLVGAGFLLPWLSQTFQSLSSLRSPARALVSYTVRAALPVIASKFVRRHLKVFDQWFLRMGKIDRIK